MEIQGKTRHNNVKYRGELDVVTRSNNGVGNENEHTTSLQNRVNVGTQVKQHELERHETSLCNIEAHNLKQIVCESGMRKIPYREADELGKRHDQTCSRQQVLQGYTWQGQGSNGLNAAQPDHPWGSTRTFRPKAGVSWALGLRHGVTMHPRGRHLREDRILLTHGGATHQRRSIQKPTTTTTQPLLPTKQMPRGCHCRSCQQMLRTITQSGHNRYAHNIGDNTCQWRRKQPKNESEQVRNSASITKAKRFPLRDASQRSSAATTTSRTMKPGELRQATGPTANKVPFDGQRNS